MTTRIPKFDVVRDRDELNNETGYARLVSDYLTIAEAEQVQVALAASRAPETPQEPKRLRTCHDRHQTHADGFQAGWHAALRRLGDGDEPDTLRDLVPDTYSRYLTTALDHIAALESAQPAEPPAPAPTDSLSVQKRKAVQSGKSPMSVCEPPAPSSDLRERLQRALRDLRIDTPNIPDWKLEEWEIQPALDAIMPLLREAAASLAPVDDQAVLVKRAVGNCYMMAKREIARITNGKAQADATSLERWQHVKRFCESAGETSSILRWQLPTELTEGALAPVPEDRATLVRQLRCAHNNVNVEDEGENLEVVSCVDCGLVFAEDDIAERAAAALSAPSLAPREARWTREQVEAEARNVLSAVQGGPCKVSYQTEAMLRAYAQLLPVALPAATEK